MAARGRSVQPPLHGVFPSNYVTWSRDAQTELVLLSRFVRSLIQGVVAVLLIKALKDFVGGFDPSVYF